MVKHVVICKRRTSIKAWCTVMKITPTPSFPLSISVKSCFHIMDVTRSRPGPYDTLNRNKAPFIRPVTTTTTTVNLTGPFSKMAAIHNQVSRRETFPYVGLYVYMNRWLYDNVPLLELLDCILDVNGDSCIRQGLPFEKQLDQGVSSPDPDLQMVGWMTWGFIVPLILTWNCSRSPSRSWRRQDVT